MRKFMILGSLAAALLAGCGSSSTSTSGGSGSTPAAAPTTSSSSSSSAPGGYGSGSAATTATTTAASAPASSGKTEALSFNEKEFKILPATATLSAPGKVTFTLHNVGTIPHAFALTLPSGTVSSPIIAPGKTATLTVDIPKSGSYTFYCPVGNHRMLGMVGTLHVD
jgi:uncharacterized cupredoxin-like copper-binding protein